MSFMSFINVVVDIIKCNIDDGWYNIVHIPREQLPNATTHPTPYYQPPLYPAITNIIICIQAHIYKYLQSYACGSICNKSLYTFIICIFNSMFYNTTAISFTQYSCHCI